VSGYLQDLENDHGMFDEILEDRGIHEFEEDFEDLLSDDRWHNVLFRTLLVAQEISAREGNVPIHSGILLRATLQASIFEPLRISKSELRKLATSTLSKQLDELRNNFTSAKEFNMLSLRDALWDTNTYAPSIAKLTPYLANFNALHRLEHNIKFARNIEPYIDKARIALFEANGQLRIREFDYLNVYKLSEPQ
jgi:hypothetical protein